MINSLINEVAREQGVSVAEVRCEMEKAIATAYINPSAIALSVPRKGAVPTPEEFIAFCAQQYVSINSGSNFSVKKS